MLSVLTGPVRKVGTDFLAGPVTAGKGGNHKGKDGK